MRQTDPRVSNPATRAGAGSEHLSSLREDYLRQLALEQGLRFHRLQSLQPLAAALTLPELGRLEPVPVDVRAALAAVAFCLLLLRHAAPLWRRRRGKVPLRSVTRA